MHKEAQKTIGIKFRLLLYFLSLKEGRLNMTKPISLTDEAKSAFVTGLGIMALQTPFVKSLNRISVVSLNNSCSTIDATKAIYKGNVTEKGTITEQGSSKPTLWNFQRGLSGHLVKELTRLGFKPLGAAMLKPRLDEAFPSSPLKASLIFAGTMSAAEMLINPADTARARLESGKPLSTFKSRPIKQLYAGSWGNGMRQFGTWAIFSYSGAHIDRLFSKHTNLDTTSFSGIAPKSIIQAFLFTNVVYPIFECPKTHLQIDPNIKGYAQVFNKVIKQGAKGFMYGFVPKLFSNALLTYGFNWQIENAKAKQIKITG